MKVYMLVTNDEYEFPVLMCDSPSELARKVGVKPNNVSSAIANARRKGRRSQYVAVDIDED